MTQFLAFNMPMTGAVRSIRSENIYSCASRWSQLEYRGQMPRHGFRSHSLFDYSAAKAFEFVLIFRQAGKPHVAVVAVIVEVDQKQHQASIS